MKAFQNAEEQNDDDIEQIKNEIDSIFYDNVNHPNYARKLYLIENCIYGVDIQSIAVQISKLRFFISLICEQTHSDDPASNFGIRPLPNLETKFVAANTLIGLDKADEDMELFNDDHIKLLIDKLQHLRHRQFTVTNAADKKKLRDRDKELRLEIENEVTQLYVKHNDDNKAFYMRQKMLLEKELELIDRSIVKSTTTATLFGETNTKTYKPNEKRRKELTEAIKIADRRLEDSSKLSRLDTVVRLAQQLTSWNPYDQNASSTFFDAAWMFGLKGDAKAEKTETNSALAIINAQIEAINAQISAINISFSLNQSHEIIKLQLVTATLQASIIELELEKIRNAVDKLYGYINRKIGTVVREPENIDYAVNALNLNIKQLNKQLRAIKTENAPIVKMPPNGFFDIIIGNPPYIKEYTDKSAFDGIRESEYYQGKMDLWYLFACKGIDLLNNEGHLCYIATNNWVTNSGASKMRNKVISDSKIVQLVDFGNIMIFESASIQTMVMIFERNKVVDNYSFDYRKLSGNTTKNDSIDLLFRRENSKATYLNPIVKRKEIVNSLLTFNNNSDDFILDKIKRKGNYELDEKNEVAQGIVFPQDTLNKKNKLILGDSYKIGEGIFQLDNLEKSNLRLSTNETELVKPYFTTEQIHRYYTSQTNSTWLIYTDSSFKKPESMNYYPNLKQHLDKYAKVITSDKKPYGLHRAREERFFKGEKIIVQRKCVGHPSFSYADFDTYVSATFYVIKSDSINHKYLLGLLNSKLIEFWLKKKGKMQGDNFQLDKEPLLDIPIHKPTEKEQFSIINYVDQILFSKQANSQSSTTALERKIDEMVFKLYDLTYAEVLVVCPDFWLSEERYGEIFFE